MAYYGIMPSHRVVFLTMCAQRDDRLSISDGMLHSGRLHLGAANLHDGHGWCVKVCENSVRLHANAQLQTCILEQHICMKVVARTVDCQSR